MDMVFEKNQPNINAQRKISWISLIQNKDRELTKYFKSLKIGHNTWFSELVCKEKVYIIYHQDLGKATKNNTYPHEVREFQRQDKS